MCDGTDDESDAPPPPGEYVPAGPVKQIAYGHLLTEIERAKFGTECGLGRYALNAKIKKLLIYNRLDLIRKILELVVKADPTYKLPSVADLNDAQGPGQIGHKKTYVTRLVPLTVDPIHNPAYLKIHKHSVIAFLRAGEGTAFTGIGVADSAAARPKLFLIPAQQGTVNRASSKTDPPVLEAYPVRAVPETSVARVYSSTITGAIGHKSTQLVKVDELVYEIRRGLREEDRRASHDQLVSAIKLKAISASKDRKRQFVGFTVCKGGFMDGRMIGNRYASTSASQNIATFGAYKRKEAVEGKKNSAGGPMMAVVEDSTTKYAPQFWMDQVRRVCNQMLVLEEDLRQEGLDKTEFCDQLMDKGASANLWPFLLKRYWSVPWEHTID